MLRLVETAAAGAGPGLAPSLAPPPELSLIEATGDAQLIAGYHRLRADAFVREQGLFIGHDLDEHDEDPRTRVLVVVESEGGRVVGGVRVHPAQAAGRDIGWWRGSRLVARRFRSRSAGELGAELVRGACRAVSEEGVLRFDAQVQDRCLGFFTRLGWEHTGELDIAGMPHVSMRWPVDRFADLANATKSPIGRLTSELLPSDGPAAAWLGDDGMPLSALGPTDLVACVDAILPAMVERDPEWAGWCGMLVTAHDLSAMGAAPFAALDTIGARDEATLRKVVAGLKAGAEFFDLPIVGGHTTLTGGARATGSSHGSGGGTGTGTGHSLTVTGLGRTDHPVPSGGGHAGDELRLTADLAGSWRPGYEGRQWDSSTHRSRDEMRAMLQFVGDARPSAAKDVSMAGIVGTAGMLAEASGCAAELTVADFQRPGGARLAEWLTCFPGFAMVTADTPGAPAPQAGPASTATIGRLVSASSTTSTSAGNPAGAGVRLVWPDGEVTTAIPGGVTGLGAATPAANTRHSKLNGL